MISIGPQKPHRLKPVWMQWWRHRTIPRELQEEFAEDAQGLIRRLIVLYHCEVPSSAKRFAEAVHIVEIQAFKRSWLEWRAAVRGCLPEKPTRRRRTALKLFCESLEEQRPRNNAEASRAWRKLSKEERGKFEQTAKDWNAQVKTDMETYKAALEPPVPKRPRHPPRSAFEYFMAVWPAGFDTPTKAQVWAQMNAEQRRHYEECAKIELEEYTRRMNRYQNYIVKFSG